MIPSLALTTNSDQKPEPYPIDDQNLESDNVSIPQPKIDDTCPITDDEKSPPPNLSTSSTVVDSISTATATSFHSPSTYTPSINPSTTTPLFDLESNIFLYRDSHFHHLATILSTLVSSLIPITAIVILYLISDMKVRLAVVCVFTAIFAVVLSLVTEAKRVEVFAATAA